MKENYITCKSGKRNLIHSPIIKKGAARLMPINSIFKYMARPNAAAVAITALMFPKRPSQGFERTVSPIIQVTMLFIIKDKEKKN
jgi:hypothetical protein